MMANKVAAAAVVACALVFAAAPAAEAANPRVVAALVAAAEKEFDAGNFARAADLFLEIWKQDKAQIVVLYNAARAAHLAGQVDRAEDLYREYLALPNADAAITAKIQPHLQDLANRRADAKAEAAAKAETTGNFALAAQLWGDAAAARPDKPAWQLRRARALHLAGDKAAALAAYDQYLARDPDKASGQGDAAKWRAELAPKSLDDMPVPKDPEVVRPVKVAEPPSKLPAYALLGGGAAAALGGLGLYLATQGDVAQFEKDTQPGADGKVAGLSYSEANSERARLNGRIYASWALGGASALAAVAGAWLLASRPAGKVAVGPTGSGVLLAVRF
ncbi:MAG: hypothetical protein FJ100_23945 [Deltaproteobacteria bacterium]|nr:hypothetical protein [Deltaproteobacteria bacterium]